MAKRIRWEYLVTEDGSALARLGEQGWELVSVLGGQAAAAERFYFKRPCPSIQEEITLSQRDRVLGGKEGGQA